MTRAAAELLRSRENPLYKRLAALKRRQGSDGGLLLIEGPRLVSEALDAGLALLELAVADGRRDDPAVREPLDRAAAAGVSARVLDDRLLASLSELETSQGLLALARAPEFDLQAAPGRVPLLLVAVEVQNPGNLGALLRTAEAAGATGAWLSAGCADPFASKSLRGSMGSAFRLPHRRGLPLEDLPVRLRAAGVRTLAAAPAAAALYDEVDLRGPLALLVGNEGAGLPAELLRAADVQVAIPLAGRAESLNVGVAAGVLLFEAARQRRSRAPA